MCGDKAAVMISKRSEYDAGPNPRPRLDQLIRSGYADDTDFLFINRANP
jgi:hypothetical protein